ncbi:MAG: glutathione S-transferase family protein [Deltaproteobacteria bacterium]|nr:glutathione S-transferase family protein [Deltaproteobacteria bacterium]
MPDEYVLHGAPISLFTRKLEAALRFYGAPFRMETKAGPQAAGIESRSGTHQVPVLETPENWMIADTTPLIALLDARFPARRLVPEGPLGVLVHVVEEVLDEWVARVMVHYRWHYDENTRHVVGNILGRSVPLEEARAFPVAQWGLRACRATGTDAKAQRTAAEREYAALLSALEAQLGGTRFALGDRPTAVDAILLGGLRAHVNNDPLPQLDRWPRCVAWDEKEADRWDGSGDLAPFPASTPFADHVLALARDAYLPFVLGNAQALADGERSFVADTYGEPVSYLARPYPERSRQMVVEHIRDRLDDAGRAAVGAWLEKRGLAQAFMP